MSALKRFREMTPYREEIDLNAAIRDASSAFSLWLWRLDWRLAEQEAAKTRAATVRHIAREAAGGADR